MHRSRLNHTAFFAAATLFALHVGGARSTPSHVHPLEAAMPQLRDAEMRTPRRRAVEIRTYTLVSGTGAEFHQLVIERSIPLLERFDVDVVAYGPSLHDPDSYILIRAFDSVADRHAADEAFYSSDDWRTGPRDEILARIESYSTVVVELDGATVDGLRAMVSAPIASAHPSIAPTTSPPHSPHPGTAAPS